MQPRSEARPASRIIAAVLSGLLCSTLIVPSVGAEPKPPAHRTAAKGPDKDRADGRKEGARMTDTQRKTAARKHYGDGTKKLAAKDYAGALLEFRTANDLIPAPQAEHKVAVCLDDLGRVAEALEAYDVFLSHANPEKMQDQIDEANVRVGVLKSMPLAVKVVSDPPQAKVAVDGVLQSGVTPIELRIAPGAHKLKVSAADCEPSERDVDIKPGEKIADLTFTLTKKKPEKPELVPAALGLPSGQPRAASAAPPPPEPAPPPEPPPATGGKNNTLAYVALGVAGAGLVAGTIFGIKAVGDKKDFDGNPTTKKADDTERDGLIADVSFGVAIALGVTGTVLLLTGGGEQASKKGMREGSDKTMRVMPIVTPHSGGAAAVWRF